MKYYYGKKDGKVMAITENQNGFSSPQDYDEVICVGKKADVPELHKSQTQKDQESYNIKYAEAEKELVEERIATKEATK